METMAELLPGAELDLVPRAGHVAALETPDEIADRLRRFLHELRD
jgi:pimeloyl-ACP methyl ester carboxylesterase